MASLTPVEAEHHHNSTEVNESMLMHKLLKIWLHTLSQNRNKLPNLGAFGYDPDNSIHFPYDRGLSKLYASQCHMA